MTIGPPATPGRRRAAAIIDRANGVLLAIGLTASFVAVAAFLLTLTFARDHLDTAVDGLRWAGRSLGAAGACSLLSRHLKKR